MLLFAALSRPTFIRRAGPAFGEQATNELQLSWAVWASKDVLLVADASGDWPAGLAAVETPPCLSLTPGLDATGTAFNLQQLSLVNQDKGRDVGR